jgi:fructose-1,6-bisphosphatase/inositol monophosphatase family enzyme
MRVFDMTASLLVLAETGGVATDTQGKPLGALTCELETRTTLLCSPSSDLHTLALNSLRAPE